MESSKKRVAGLDILRVMAILTVITVHFLYNTNFYKTPLEGWAMTLQTWFRWSLLVSVPTFLLLTGYLNFNKVVSRSYYGGILKVLIPYFIYSALAIAYRIYWLGENHSVLEWIYLLLHFKAIGYAWYVEMYIGLFLLSPFLNRLYKALSRNEKLALIGTLVFMTSSFGSVDLMNKILPQYWMAIYPVTYYIIGAYIREYQPQIGKIRGWLLFGGISLIYLIVPTFIYGGEPFKRIFGGWGSLPVLISSTLFFILLYKSDIKNFILKRFVTSISMVSFDMYLVSFIVDGIVYKILMERYFLTQQQVFPYIFIVVPIVFFSTYLVGLVRSKVIS